MKDRRDIPLLPGAGRLGHLAAFRADRVEFLKRVVQFDRDLSRVQLLVKPAYFVTSPALLQEVLVSKAKSFEKSRALRLALYPLAGEGLFTSRGELWKRQRRLMAPMFQHGQIAQYARSMAGCAARGMEAWKPGESIDVAREMTRITMSVAGETLFEADTFDQADELGAALTTALDWTNHHAGALPQILQIRVRFGLEKLAPLAPAPLRARLTRLITRLEAPVLIPGEESRALQEAIDLLNRRVQRMIDDRRAAGLTRPDLMTRLLAARDEGDGLAMSDQQVRDEILTLFVAGHETTATALAWSFYLLARHPEVYARVQAEADALGHAPTADDLPRLAYTGRVFKEVLRLYPPVYFFSRESTQEVEIGGYLFPARSLIFISPWVIHRRPDLWPEPLRFDPDRFTPEAEAGRAREAWLPFSGGPRVCIGNHFSLMEGPIVLAAITRRVTLGLTSPEEVLPEPTATLRPKRLVMTVQARTPATA